MGKRPKKLRRIVKTKQLASADVAQSVERRLGKAEVTGSIPVISLLRKIPGNRDLFVI